MATHAISWAPGAHVRFGDLDFIVTLGGELALTHMTAQSLPSINLSRLRLEGPRGDSLGPSYLGSPHAASPYFRKAPYEALRQRFRSVSAMPQRPPATFCHYAWFSRLRIASSWG